MRKLMVITVGVVIPGLLLLLVWKGYNAVFEANVNPELAPYELYVAPGTTLETVYEEWFESGLLLQPEGFYLIGKKKGLDTLKTGHYFIEEGMSSNGIVNMLKAGLQTPVKVSFNSAKDLHDLADQLSPQLLTDAASLYAALQAPMEGWEGPLKQGAFLPDTYEFYWNASAETVANKLYQNTISFWTPSRIRQAKELGLTPGEVSTLASIVMKESSKADDRPKVARLYLNRLATGMKLQADPTVIYTIQQEKPDAVVQRVLRKDLTIDSPYNTYKNVGLPPGPICVPEKAALLAVLEAPEHDYIFMCADPDQPGYHAFARNYAGHLVNQRKWTNWLNSRKIYR